MAKPKVALFDFTCCEGCQLQIANMGEAVIDILDKVNIVMWREVLSEKSDEYDIAIIEGSITTPHDIERLKTIRDTAKVIIALGSCATIGGINGMKNSFDLGEIKKYVYNDKADCFGTIKTRAIHQVVPVEYMIHGCPIRSEEFIKVIKAALRGLPYSPPNNAVCIECKLNENECMYDKDITCLGPVTRAGCDSWCINNGNICYGCRGMLDDPALDGQIDILKKYNIPLEWITGKMDMYNKPKDLGEEII